MANAFMCGFGRYTDEAGKDGVSPTVTVTPISGGNRVEITDVNGTKSFDVMNGQDGKDGEDGKDGAGITEIPYFDLTTLGLPTIETSKKVFANVDRDDVAVIRAALDKGQVKFKFTANATLPNATSTGDETVEAFATANVVIFNSSDDNYYDCAIIKPTYYSTGYCFVAINIRFRLLEDGGYIEAASTVLGSTVATT